MKGTSHLALAMALTAWLGDSLPHSCYVPRSSAIRRSGSTSPLGFARASPSPPSHAEHGTTLARKLSLGGGRPYTPSPQGEPLHRCWVQPLNSGRTGSARPGWGHTVSIWGVDLANPFSPSWNYPRAAGLERGALPSRS